MDPAHRMLPPSVGTHQLSQPLAAMWPTKSTKALSIAITSFGSVSVALIQQCIPQRSARYSASAPLSSRPRGVSLLGVPYCSKDSRKPTADPAVRGLEGSHDDRGVQAIIGHRRARE